MIYITGSEGFIGSRLKEKLKEPYTCIDKKLGTDLLTMNWNLFVRRHSAPKTIIHLAALTNPRDSMDYLEDYYLNNCVATRKLFEHFPNSRFIYLSTSLVEHDTHNFYSMTKLLNEIDAKSHSNALGIRATTVYGDGARENMIVPKIIKGDCEYLSTYTRDFIWVDDLVNLIIDLTKTEDTGIMNVSSGDVHSIMKLANDFGVNAPEYNPKDEPETNVIKNEGLMPTMTVTDYIRSRKTHDSI